MNLLGLLAAAPLIILGLAGVFLPLLPGPLLVYAGVFVYAYLTHYAVVTAAYLWIMGGLCVFALTSDYLVAVLGIKGAAGSLWGTVGALVGSAVGLISLGPVGSAAGLAAGAVAGEILSGKRFSTALNTAAASLLGLLTGTILQLLASLAIVVLFAWLVF